MVQDPARRGQIQNARDRRKKFMSTTLLLAFDGDDVVRYHEAIYELLDRNLKRCEICVRRYHLERTEFLAQLRQDYDEPEIKDFLSILDRRDVARITEGLTNITRVLKELPEGKRSVSAVDPSDLFSLFEALHCRKFHESEENLSQYFDEPFKLIQTKKPLKLNEILPAVTKFLFDSNTLRLSWAVETWARTPRSLSDFEWDHAVKDIVEQRIRECNNPSSSNKLWTALKVIIRNMSADGISHRLLALDPPFYRLALDHLFRKTFSIPAIVLSLREVWEKAPDAFWQSTSSMPVQQVIDSVFGSACYDQCLNQSVKGDASVDDDVLSWIPVYLKSLHAVSRPTACRPLVGQLFKRVRSDELSNEARAACLKMAIKAILHTICSFSEHEDARKPASRHAIADTFEIVTSYLSDILNPPAFVEHDVIRNDTMAVVRNIIALDCYCLKSDFDHLNARKLIGHEKSSFAAEIWSVVIANLHDSNLHLSRAALTGTLPFTGIDEIRLQARNLTDLSSDDQKLLKKEMESFNNIFKSITDKVADLLGKIAEFKPEHLDGLFKEQQTSMVLFASLFSGHEATYQAALDAIKNISGTYGRKEALDHLLQAFFSTSIYAIDWVFRRCANMRTFASVPRLLKVGADVMDLLCDSTGLLRTQKLDSRSYSAVQSYWSYQWAELKVIFQHTEQWSLEIHDKELMMNVARDAMQYAQNLFEKYHLFLNLLQDAKPDKAQTMPEILLDTDPVSTSGSPAKCFYNMTQWLRLRDQYLANTLTSLITNMLRRLKDFSAEVQELNLDYLLAVLMPGYAPRGGKAKAIRTILNAHQKAELTRAIEYYLGKAIKEHPNVKKQSTLKSWTQVGSRSSATPPTSEIIEIDDDDDEFDDATIKDEDFYDLSEQHTTIQKAKRERAAELAKSTAAAPSKPKPLPLSSKIAPSGSLAQEVRERAIRDKQAARGKAFIEQRNKERAAIEARKKEAALRLRGNMGVGEHTAGAGSALSGIGVRGKDHATGQSHLMVSSSSESDSEDDDDELFGKVHTVQQRGGLRKPLSTGPTRKVKQVRSQKDIRARLTPDLSPLHKEILGWDFFADSETPPSSNKSDYTLVTSSFKTPQEYVKTFEPLLVLEAWQSFRSAREEGNFKIFEIKVASSLIVDNFFEVNTVIPMAEQKELALGTSDVVLLSTGKHPTDEKDKPHCLARVKEISRKKGEVQIVYRINAANNPLRSHLNDKATVYGAHIQSLTPLEREYSALMALEYYDLCDEIIRAKPSPLLEYNESDLVAIQESYNVNVAQAKAVKSAIDNDAFTLVQGPPGSGKTKTICAIVGALLTGLAKLPQSKPPVQNGKPAPPPSAKKMLVCAPSNAAVDELVMRFKSGVKLMNGSDEQINVVRLGRSDAINTAVKDVTLEELVNAKLSVTAPKESKEDIHTIMMEHKATSDKLHEHRNMMDASRVQGKPPSADDEKVFDGLKRKKTALGAKIDSMREQQNNASRDADVNRRRVQQEVLDSAHVLCATLSGSGHEIFQGLNVEFETVIIDEAAQSIELSALIPLKYGCNKCILVGDPKQLPPTVLSREAARFQYQQSLFARMEGNHRKDVHLLDTQYRMHPEISSFPSRTFYDSRLKDGAGMAKLRARPWHHSAIFAPYRFFDVQGMSHAATKGHSLVNIAELNIAMQLYDRLITDVPKYDFKGKIGIITPYKGQLREMKMRFKNRYGESILSDIEFNTTDAFQGRESEIIIFSCVRASTQGLGFLNDIRRMNVGLTRAKCSLWVLGNCEALTRGEYWRSLVNDAKTRNVYTDGDIAKVLRRPLLTEDMMKNDVEMEDIKNPGTMEHIKPEPDMDRQPSPVSRSREAAKPAAASSGRDSSSERIKPQVSRRSSNTSLPNRPVNRQAGSTTPSDASETKPRIKQQSPAVVPKPEPDGVGRNGAAGGRFGLNDKANCRICGSHAHFTHNCDNQAAVEASVGTCDRCKKGGHTYATCREPRCTACGQMGHLNKTCDTPPERRLTESERETVKQQEIDFGRQQDRARQRLSEKRLGEHGARIPTVRTSTPNDSELKRKRDSEPGKEIKPLKATRTEYGPPATHTSGQHPDAIRPSGSGRPPGAPQIIKRKKPKAEDMFMKRK